MFTCYPQYFLNQATKRLEGRTSCQKTNNYAENSRSLILERSMHISSAEWPNLSFAMCRIG